MAILKCEYRESTKKNILRREAVQRLAIRQPMPQIRIFRNLVEAITNWGNALSGAGRTEEAIEKYQRATELNPRHRGAFLNWAMMLYKLDQPASALEKFQKAIDLGLAGEMLAGTCKMVRGNHKEVPRACDAYLD